MYYMWEGKINFLRSEPGKFSFGVPRKFGKTLWIISG